MHPQILQHHFHIPFDVEQLIGKPAPVRLFLLEQKMHGGDGCFDLMGPQGVIVQHVRLPAVRFGTGFSQGIQKGLQHFLIGLLAQLIGLRQAFQRFGQAAGSFAELQDAFPVAPEVHGGCNQTEYGAQQQRVQHIRHRQVLEQQHHGEDAAE